MRHAACAAASVLLWIAACSSGDTAGSSDAGVTMDGAPLDGGGSDATAAGDAGPTVSDAQVDGGGARIDDGGGDSALTPADTGLAIDAFGVDDSMPGCLANGRMCTQASECCSGSCAGGACGFTCIAAGGPCTSGAACCSGTCAGGMCTR